jgi:hypothetical protein
VVTVVICSYFEEEYIARIRKVDGRLQVLYREDLVSPPRWPGDHVGLPGWRRSEEGEEEFLAMLKEAEVLYDFPRGHVKDLLQVAPKLPGSKRALQEPEMSSSVRGCKTPT